MRARTRYSIPFAIRALCATVLSLSSQWASGQDVRYSIEQGNQFTIVSPLDGPTDVVNFYDYNALPASSNTGLEQSDTSILFLYRDNIGTLSLVMIHDDINDGSGGAASFSFAGVPAGTSFVVRDDAVAAEAVLGTSTWRWADCCTDGGALSGSLNQEFCISILPDFPLTGGLSSGRIDDWEFLTGDINDPGELALDLADPVIICCCTPVDNPDVRTQGFWKRICKGPHPSGEHENLPDYVDFVSSFAAQTFGSVASEEDICDRLNPDPKNDKCEQAEAQFMALMLNIASGRISTCNFIDDPDLGPAAVGEAAKLIDTLLSGDPTFEDCVLAQSLAEAINEGQILVD